MCEQWCYGLGVNPFATQCACGAISEDSFDRADEDIAEMKFERAVERFERGN